MVQVVRYHGRFGIALDPDSVEEFYMALQGGFEIAESSANYLMRVAGALSPGVSHIMWDGQLRPNVG